MADPQWWPVDNVRITGQFGADADWYMQNVGQRGHNGIDLGGEWGTPLYAIDDGVVVQEGWDIPWSGVAGGIAMIVRCAWGHFGLAHCADTRVSVGDEFRRGYRLGSMGNTGLALGVHAHSETLPLYPNFNNGFSGRVNPAALINLQPRGTLLTPTSTPDGQEEEDDMAEKNKGMAHNEGGVGSVQTVIIGHGPSGWKFKYTTRVFPSGQRNPENEKWTKFFDTGDFETVPRDMLDAWERSLDNQRLSK